MAASLTFSYLPLVAAPQCLPFRVADGCWVAGIVFPGSEIQKFTFGRLESLMALTSLSTDLAGCVPFYIFKKRHIHKFLNLPARQDRTKARLCLGGVGGDADRHPLEVFPMP